MPFDLRTDRYLEYDRDKPAAAGDQLIQALRATIDSERRDSPVFLLLPELQPPKREAFLIVPEEFGKEVDRARNERQPGDLALLTAEARSFSWEVSALRTVGRAQFKLKAFAAARTTWERVLEFSENDVEANLLLGTIYQRLGDLTASNAVLRENVEAALAIPELGGEETKPQKPLHVFLFTGHQIDSPGRKTPRFPPDREDVARREIKAKIEQEMRGLTDAPKLGFAGAASGGDILFHEICAELGIPTLVYLALPENKFINESVAPAEGNWVDRFRALLRSKKENEVRQLAETDEMPKWLRDRERDYGIWQCNNLWMLHNALALGGEHTTLIALWNGEGGDGPGGTKDMVDQAQEQGARTIIINTKEGVWVVMLILIHLNLT